MRIIDRYLTKSIIFNFLGTLLVFSLLFVLIDSASNLDEYIDRKVSPDIIVEYYMWFLPVVIQQTIAIAYLIGCLLTYANLNTHNELIALRAGGLNFWKLARPALVFGLVIAAFMFYLNEIYIPQAESRARMIKQENFSLEVDRKKNKSIINNLTFYGMHNRLYFIDSFDPNKAVLRGITIVGFDANQDVREKIVALEGVWTGIAWKFKQCNITPFQNIEEGPTKIKVYDEKLMDIKETPEDFARQRQNVKYMNLKQLNDYIQKFSKSGTLRAVENLYVDLHAKIAYPFTPIIILLVGLPIVMMSGHRRAQTFAALGIAIMIGFLFYVVNAVGLALGKGGVLPPYVAAWVAQAFFGLAALYIIRTKL
ncbi:MAG: LptF/LptG family permease [Candidatus Omnitrophota bacterium]